MPAFVETTTLAVIMLTQLHFNPVKTQNDMSAEALFDRLWHRC